MVSVNLPMKLYIVLLLCSPIVINTEQETRTPANMVILAGVMKAGTTSLWEAMLQHPNIHSGLVAKGMRGTDKELHFFDTQTVCHNGNVLQRGRGNASAWDLYKRKLPGVPSGHKILDATPKYFSMPKSAMSAWNTLMHKREGRKTKLIVLLRDPVDRALSQWRHYERELDKGNDSGRKREQQFPARCREFFNCTWAQRMGHNKTMFQVVRQHINAYQSCEEQAIRGDASDPVLRASKLEDCFHLKTEHNLVAQGLYDLLAQYWLHLFHPEQLCFMSFSYLTNSTNGMRVILDFVFDGNDKYDKDLLTVSSANEGKIMSESDGGKTRDKELAMSVLKTFYNQKHRNWFYKYIEDHNFVGCGQNDNNFKNLVFPNQVVGLDAWQNESC
eukprot:m.227195 g.227195  ORF g.227195 m.227195 type:complete len:387 (-) comp15970_c1_seq15:2907-4067(-)